MATSESRMDVAWIYDFVYCVASSRYTPVMKRRTARQRRGEGRKRVVCK
jgi:hypothetical protein